MDKLTERQGVVVEAMKMRHGHINVYRDDEGFLMVDTGPQVVVVDRDGATASLDSGVQWRKGWK